MSETFLLDTNIVSAYLNLPKLVGAPTATKEQVKRVRDRVADLANPIFSALTVWEIERGLAKDGMRRHQRSFRSLCMRSTVLPVDEMVLTAAVDIWACAARAGRQPGDVDALLVATARRWGYLFVSGDANALECAGAQRPEVPAQNWFVASAD